VSDTVLTAPPAIVPVALVALFAIGTACGFLLVRWAIERRPRAVAHGDASAAADRARNALDAIELHDAPAAYAELGTALRAYLDARFGPDMSALPGPDIERAMTRVGTTRPAARLTAHLLERCDAMRSAASQPTEDRLRADIRTAREIIDLTATERQA
jgi:hypothetical protein